MNPTTADDIGKLLLRIVLSVLIGLHGVGKLLHGVGPIPGMVEGTGLPPALAYGVFLGEVLGPALLLLGWYGRVGAGLITINMIVAISLAHRQMLFTLSDHGGWALELQGMYLVTALALAIMGPGRVSFNQR